MLFRSFGEDRTGANFFDTDKLVPVHHLVKNNQEDIEEFNQKLREMALKAQENLIRMRSEVHEKLNEKRSEKKFKPNDIVYLLDRYTIIGNSRPLKSKYYPSPWVVIKPYFTTCLIKRLADGFTGLYSFDDMKLYKGSDPIFSTIPPEVSKVLLNKFTDLLDEDYKIILKHDPLDIPEIGRAHV